MKDLFKLPDDQAEKGKVVPLSEAIAETVKPGMTIHLNTGAYANAAIREIIRQYWDKDPAFTLVSAGVTTPFEIGMACSGLVKRVISTNHGYTYPTPRPIPLLQEMERKGRIEMESWSLYSLEQRLMAGAWDVGFLPTKSLMGTNLGMDNAHAFKTVSNPFDSGRQIGVVKALTPDISIIHGCVADRDGNVILAPPYFASIWGPKASKGGVIATVEKVVSSDYIRHHSALVKLPACLVKFVCSVPFGAHPQGLSSESIGLGEGYGEDYDFILDSVTASADGKNLREWLDEWVIECGDQDGYLSKLGSEKLAYLKGKSSSGAWRDESPRSTDRRTAQSGFNPTEWMVVAGAREIKEIVTTNGYKTILAGIGSPALSAWLAFYFLKNEGYDVQMLTGLGLVGYAPRPGDPFLMTLSNVMTCTMLTDAVEVYGTLVGGANNRCLSVLGTAEIDQYGNINTVRIGGSPFIGVGGAGDAVNARETLVVAKQSRNRFQEKLSYVGCPGRGIRTLVTDLGIYKKLGMDETFTLTKVLVDAPQGKREERVREIKEKCGWKLKLSSSLQGVSSPTLDELALLRALDPEGVFTGVNNTALSHGVSSRGKAS